MVTSVLLPKSEGVAAQSDADGSRAGGEPDFPALAPLAFRFVCNGVQVIISVVLMVLAMLVRGGG